MIKIHLPADPDYVEMLGVGGEFIWATPIQDGLYRIDNTPLFTLRVLPGDVVRASPSTDTTLRHEVDGTPVFQLDELIEWGGRVVYHVVSLAQRDVSLTPEKDPALQELWRAWEEIAATGATFEGGQIGATYVLAIDAPAEADHALIAGALNRGEAQEEWIWASSAR